MPDAMQVTLKAHQTYVTSSLCVSMKCRRSAMRLRLLHRTPMSPPTTSATPPVISSPSPTGAFLSRADACTFQFTPCLLVGGIVMQDGTIQPADVRALPSIVLACHVSLTLQVQRYEFAECHPGAAVPAAYEPGESCIQMLSSLCLPGRALRLWSSVAACGARLSCVEFAGGVDPPL